MRKCQERSGFLFAHGCDHQASDKCTGCGKAICLRHSRRTSSGTFCVSCAKKQEQGDARAVDRDRYHRDPYFYGYYYYPGYHYYDERDYRAFDRQAQGQERAGIEDDPDGS
jgi:hypothetical protein